LKTDLFRVIPTFESDEAWGATKTAIMKPTPKDQPKAKHDLGHHLELIKQIAARTVENTLDDTDLTGMTENPILRVFIKFDQSPN